jgi:myo-inositol-hexaphosphate 3-phosphohydrolase
LSRVLLLAACLSVILAAVSAGGYSNAMSSSVGSVPARDLRASSETAPVPHRGDAADDAAIWIDPARPGRSVVIGTDKLGGLAVYALSGRQLRFYPDSQPNGVDLRSGFRLARRLVTLVATGDRVSDSIRLYAVEPRTRTLRYVAARPIATGIGVAGICMYRSRVTGKLFVFVSDSSGTVQQWEVFSDSRGTADARRVRTLKLASTTEGCVADDALGRLYLAEEDEAIWRYSAEPGSGSARIAVDRVGPHLAADIEGLALSGSAKAGYLIASSQGSDSFAVYRRSGANGYVASFRIVDGRVDGVTHTDGIDVTTRSLGTRFPAGVFIAQDDRNDAGNQNFKLVSWGTIARVLNGARAPIHARVVGRTYYVDVSRGGDANTGTSVRDPWKTLQRASAASLKPGDRLLLRRGRTWVGTLTVNAAGTNASPVAVGAYGTGAMPRITGGSSCIMLAGSHLVLRGIHGDGCGWAGTYVAGDHNRVERMLLTRNAAGIYVKQGADANTIVRNRLANNDKMSVLTTSPSYDDSGAFGIALNGDANDVGFNTITGSDAFSRDFGRDGSAVEIYGGRRNLIHHNLAIDNNAFAELGHRRTSDNTFAYNVVRSRLRASVGVVTRGARSGFGPVLGTRLHHNTIALSGALSEGFVCHGGCADDVLQIRNTIVAAVGKVGFADHGFDEDYNLFFGATIQFPMGSHSVVADPAFLNRARGNLRLRRSSRAIDRGIQLGYARDFDGRRAKVDGNLDGRAAPDLGAFEYAPSH